MLGRPPKLEASTTSAPTQAVAPSRVHRLPSWATPPIPPTIRIRSTPPTPIAKVCASELAARASDLSVRPSRSYRQPLPPIPGASPNAQGSEYLGHGYPDTVHGNQSAAGDAYRARMPSQNSLQHQSSFSHLPASVMRTPSQPRTTASPGDEKRQMAHKYSHERVDSLAWEPGLQPSAQGRTSSFARGTARQPCASAEWSLLSTVALLLRAKVPRGVQIKGSIDYPNSFTGKDVVSTLQELLVSDTVGSRHALVVSGDAAGVRQVALSLAKSLKSQLFFHEVDWGEKELTDDVDEVYTFLEDSLADMGSAPADPDDWTAGLNHNSAFDSSLSFSVGGAAADQARKPANTDLDDLPNGVYTPLTRCYSPLCSPVARQPATARRAQTQPQAPFV